MRNLQNLGVQKRNIDTSTTDASSKCVYAAPRKYKRSLQPKMCCRIAQRICRPRLHHSAVASLPKVQDWNARFGQSFLIIHLLVSLQAPEHSLKRALKPSHNRSQGVVFRTQRQVLLEAHFTQNRVNVEKGSGVL